MNQVPVKLGPMALLLTIISICLTTLSILTYTTSGADLRLAQKYAQTVSDRYELEKEGQEFLLEASDAAGMGIPLNSLPDTVPAPDGSITRTFEKDGTILSVTLVPGEMNGCSVSEWKILRQWEENASIGNIWMPE